MSKVRIVVEWVFGDILEYFLFLDFKRNFKVGFSVVGKMYIICVLLRNVYLCIYGLIIFFFFGVELFLLD